MVLEARNTVLQDGTEVVLRPIKPEDEPLWLEMLGNCSTESIYSRFRYFFHWESPEIAERYCYIDNDSEIAIVAELRKEGRKELIGIGRLIFDPDDESVEYAILIEDSWQKKDLGNILTDYCLEIARNRNLKRFIAQTTTDNRKMIAVFRKRGFMIETNTKDSTVNVLKIL
ncbi:MAG: GNAT family N-acetyltransferase [Bacteroidota bacterium]|nr:GNAT family N-acetyltransferase [Bacteroidota bacterium]